MKRKTLLLGSSKELYKRINQEFPELITLQLESPFEAMRLRHDTDILLIECNESDNGHLLLIDCLIKEYQTTGAEVYLIGSLEYHQLYQEQDIAGFLTPNQLLEGMTKNIGIAS